MSFIIGLLKIFASFIFICFFIVSLTKANPRTHNPAYRPAAEYMTGFLFFFCSLAGLYYLWR